MAGTGFQSDAAAMVRAISGFDESAANVTQTMRALDGDLRHQAPLQPRQGARTLSKLLWQRTCQRHRWIAGRDEPRGRWAAA